MDITLQELISAVSGDVKPKPTMFTPGRKYFIRSVTNYYVGRVSTITDTEVTLEDASWIPDTGRFNDALVTGSFSEIEPYPHPVAISRGAICDYTEWSHDLPREQK